jgi:hypothetical protein
MTFDPTVTLGNLLTIITIACAVITVVVSVRADVTALKGTVISLAARLERHETIVFRLAENLQRVIGRLEGTERASVSSE